MTGDYSANNILYHDDKIIYPGNYANAVFLIALNSSAALGKATLYLVILGLEATEDGASIVRLDSIADDTYPKLSKTTSGRLYVVWSKQMTALIRANIFKLY